MDGQACLAQLLRSDGTRTENAAEVGVVYGGRPGRRELTGVEGEGDTGQVDGWGFARGRCA